MSSARLRCETCGSTDRVCYHGMDSTLLCWTHMLEANAKEDAYAAQQATGTRGGVQEVSRDEIIDRLLTIFGEELQRKYPGSLIESEVRSLLWLLGGRE